MLRTVSALAAATATLAAAGLVQASTLVIGGLAGACSSLARQGRHGPDDLDICTRAISLQSLNLHDLAGTYVNRGSMELGARMYDEADSDFRQAMQIMPAMGEAHIGEGAYFDSEGRFPEAEREISRGLAMGSEEPEKGYYFRAIARWGQDDFKGAYDDFQHAVMLKPTWALPREELKNFHVEEAR